MKSDSIEEGIHKSVVSANRGAAIFAVVLRILGFMSTLSSAILMLTSSQTLRFSNRYFHFRAVYSDVRAFTLFVIVNGLASAYMLLSLAQSIVHIFKTRAQNSRFLLIIFDVAMMGVLTSGACAAAAVVVLAHNGGGQTNWAPVCQQYIYFCKKISASLIGSFVGVVVLMALIINSAVALSRSY